MITVEEFDAIQVNDLVETYPLCPGLSKEPVVLRVVEKTNEELHAVATWFGVALGRWVAFKGKKNNVMWRF